MNECTEVREDVGNRNKKDKKEKTTPLRSQLSLISEMSLDALQARNEQALKRRSK